MGGIVASMILSLGVLYSGGICTPYTSWMVSCIELIAASRVGIVRVVGSRMFILIPVQ